jgi:hypothetical protein
VDVALPYVSTATIDVPLPPLGRLGIDPTLMIALPSFIIPKATGMGSITFQVPNLPTLAGVEIHTQALVLRYPMQPRLTNVNTDRVLR